MTFLRALAFEAHTGHHELPFEPWVVGAIGMALFIVLAAVTFSFRDVANRHAKKAEQYAREHGKSAPEHREQH